MLRTIRSRRLLPASLAFATGLAALFSGGQAAALVLTAGDVTISDCFVGSACIDVNPGGTTGEIALNPIGSTTVDIDIFFNGRIVLGDPGFGPPPFPGFPPPANPWMVTVTFETNGDNPGITFPLEDDDLVFTGLDGGAPDVEVLASNVNVQSVVLAGGVLTWTFNVSQAQAGLAPGLGFTDFHLRDIIFDLGDNATLDLTQVRIDPASVDVQDLPAPATLTLLGFGLAGLGFAARNRRHRCRRLG